MELLYKNELYANPHDDADKRTAKLLAVPRWLETRGAMVPRSSNFGRHVLWTLMMSLMPF